jgi:hypothetical protein
MRLVRRVAVTAAVIVAILYAMTYGPRLIAVVLGCAFVGVLVLAIVDNQLQGRRQMVKGRST